MFSSVCALRAQAAGIGGPRSSGYAQLLARLDEAASHGIDGCLDSMDTLTEPHVARELASVLPKGPPCIRPSQNAHCCPVSVTATWVLSTTKEALCMVCCPFLWAVSWWWPRGVFYAEQATASSWATACLSGTWTCTALRPARVLPCHAAADRERCARTPPDPSTVRRCLYMTRPFI